MRQKSSKTGNNPFERNLKEKLAIFLIKVKKCAKKSSKAGNNPFGGNLKEKLRMYSDGFPALTTTNGGA